MNNNSTKTKKRNALPSGQVRIQRRYKDEFGKSHLKSFTAPTKREAEALASEWLEHRRQVTKKFTVDSAVEKYIRLKEPILSPSTVRGYETIRERYLAGPLAETDLLQLTNLDIQVWISNMVAKGYAPKTVRSAYGLLTATLGVFMPDFPVKVSLPPKKKQELYCPSIDEVNAVLNVVTDPELRAAILLAAVGTLRKGEICALTWDDIEGRNVHVRSAMVKNEWSLWEKKSPKTYDSYRTVPMTDEVMEAIHALPKRKDGKLIGTDPDLLGHRFARAVKAAGVHYFRFHDLRHFSCSQMHLMGIPDKYIEARGGWKPGSNVMKRTYQTVINLEQKKQDKKILEAFEKLG